MKKLSSLLITTAASALALGTGLTGGACSSSGKAGTDGSSGGIPLTSSATGFVQDATSGVVGAWYAYGDSVGSGANMDSDDRANSDCILKGGFTFDQCSQINNPMPGKEFVPTNMATSQQCTDGTAALVLNKGTSPDYTDLWGAGIGLDFNNPGGDAGVKGYKDLSTYKGVSFTFSGDIVPAKSMRVNFPFMGQHGTDSPYWDGGGDGAMSSSPLTGTTAAPQKVVIHWADVGGPAYLVGQTPSINPLDYPFTPTAIQAIQFQVFTNVNTATPYSFCVSNLTLLTE